MGIPPTTFPNENEGDKKHRGKEGVIVWSQPPQGAQRLETLTSACQLDSIQAEVGEKRNIRQLGAWSILCPERPNP